MLPNISSEQIQPSMSRGIRLGASFNFRESALLLALVALVGVAIFGPSVSQLGGDHRFADQRSWFGVTHAADVLSNIPFALGGLSGLSMLSRADSLGKRGFNQRGP